MNIFRKWEKKNEKTCNYYNINWSEIKKALQVVKLFVDLPGFEPRQTVPKTVVLPLHNRSISFEAAKLILFFKRAKKNFIFFVKPFISNLIFDY